MKKPSLYVVATPIGNKSDMSLRALEVLKMVDIIACEDSRVSKKLLESYDINKPLISYHKFNEKQRTEEFLKLLKSGKEAAQKIAPKVALISDAGTPCISDPGRILVNELFEQGIEITSIPGACAISTFLSQIPRNREEFAFIGFLPRTQQEAVFAKFAQIDMVFYEAANRLIKTLKIIKDFRGAETKVSIGRELTKVHEETLTDTVENILKHYETHTLKGEVVVMLYAQDKNESEPDEFEITEKIKKLKALKYTDKDISAILSTLYGYNKNKVYNLCLAVISIQ